MKNKENVVRTIASKIVNRYKLSPPINFDVIIEGEGIEYEEDELSFDGYSVLNSEPNKIVINRDTDYVPRKRFTIAHELGHCLIPWHDDVTACQTDEYYVAKNMLDIQEKEANVFAAELLMPTSWVKNIISEISNKGIECIVSKIMSLSGTSVMACMYSLEHAFEPGHVMLVTSYNMEYVKKFISKDTCTTWYRGLDIEDTCEYFCIFKEECKIYSYTVKHYVLQKCPDKIQIVKAYNESKGNLENTLQILSQGRVRGLLHCLKSIIDNIEDNYYVIIFYNDETRSVVKKEKCLVNLPYNVEYCDAIDYCRERYESYGTINIERNWKIFWVKEPYYVEDMKYIANATDSKTLLKEMLRDIYTNDEIIKKSQIINGIIGSANSSNLNESREVIYNAMKIKLNRKEIEEFVLHPRFDEFISLRLNDIIERREGKRR